MECFLKKVIDDKIDAEAHRYFIRFGKGVYNRRFLISYNKSKRIKIKGSFEWANDFVKFASEIEEIIFSGKIMSKDQIPGQKARKKGGSFVYEVEEIKLEHYPGAYSYLLDAEGSGIKLKIKKSLPKPGKDAEKVDDSFCVMELDEKYWELVKKIFFWDVSEGKKAIIEHSLIVESIDIPKNEKDPVKMRENAVRIGRLVRNMDIDGKKEVRDYKIRA
jgi:hypothetical protein